MALTQTERTAVRVLIVILISVTLVLPHCIPFIRFWRAADKMQAKACAHARSIACGPDLADKSPEFNQCERARNICKESRFVNALMDTIDYVGFTPLGRWFAGRSTLTVVALMLVAGGLYMLFATYTAPGCALPLPGGMRDATGKKWA
jgi:hypothetical protein